MKKDHRLYFFALVPPEEIQASVTEIKKDFRDRFKAGHALKSPPHITLIPPFEFLFSDENRLIKYLELFASKESSFLQVLENFGTFPPKVIYVRVLKTESLLDMYKRFRKFMELNLGLGNKSFSPGKFKPHMTVAFRDLTPENFYLAKTAYAQKQVSFRFLVQSICLLRHNGQHWDILHEAVFKT
jgi:2'-5' RNA ligase